MIKYTLVAAALKLFSCCPQMRDLYRLLGNLIGSRVRARKGPSRSRLDRARQLLELVKRHKAIRDGHALLEIGTGWLHWESILLRLYYDVNITLFDVWDNRSLDTLRRWSAELDKVIDTELHLAPSQYERVHSLLNAIAAASTFDDLYSLLGFQYLIEPSGSLAHFQDESFDAIYSCNVLEHVSADTLPEYIRDSCRLLRPGGYSIHTIDISDHFRHYDQSVSAKHYLRYSDAVWKRCFENKVQYFNRVQRSEWLGLFEGAGFQLVEEKSLCTDLGALKVNEEYQHLDRRDLECISLRVLYRKPSTSALSSRAGHG